VPINSPLNKWGTNSKGHFRDDTGKRRGCKGNKHGASIYDPDREIRTEKKKRGGGNADWSKDAFQKKPGERHLNGRQAEGSRRVSLGG